MNGHISSHDAEKGIVKQQTPQPPVKAEHNRAQQVNPAVVLQRMAASPSSTLDAVSILTLQRAIGNQAVQRLLARRAQGSTTTARTLSRQPVQPKLTVGAAGDKYEQEADHVAARVMSMPAPAAADHAQRQNRDEEEEKVQMKPLAASVSPLAQRAAVAPEEEEEKGLLAQAKPSPEQTEAGGAFDAGSDVESGLAESRGAGSPLPHETRAFMESRFGADFSDVRVHTDGKAVQLNREVSAQAFTHGADIYFGNGKYSPDTDSGKQLLAHELTHVIQQRGSI
ncbi:MAG: DUF4157 domain-containing protein [Pyrinomonadaceae bacterium]